MAALLSHGNHPRATRTFIVGAVVLFAVLALCLTTHSARAQGINVADPDVVDERDVTSTSAPVASSSTAGYEAHLAKMTDEQLKKMLMDRSAGKKIDWKKHSTREAVMDALLAEDREEARRKAFLHRVELAREKQAKSPIKDDFHTVNIVYCPHTSYEADVHRYEEALFEKAATAKKLEELEKKAKKEKKTSDGEAAAEKKPVVTFTELEKSLFLPNANRVKFAAEEYPLPKYNQVKAQVFTILFVVSMGLSFMVGQLTFIPEKIRTYLTQHRTLVVSTGLMFNMFSSSAARTGAFEVYVDGSLVYSHLAHGGTKAALPALTFLSELLTEKTLLLPYGV